MNNYARPRRSMLYVPGCNLRYLNKARSLRVDSVILDLGDPILVEAKVQSRLNVVEAVKQGGYGPREVVVRVNDFDSPWGQDDIKAVANIGADAILFPNVETREDVLNAIDALNAAGNTTTPIMVMIESPLAVLNAKEIASASDRIACMVIATSDLMSQLRARKTHERIALVTSLSLVILAARAYGRAVVDGITNDLNDMQTFEYSCRLGRDLGFDGKTLVHPSQLDYSNDAYTPRPTEIKHAQTIIEALAQANAAGRGTVVVDGKLVEHHHVAAAQQLLELSATITTLEEGYD
ncbi:MULTISPECIES: HpcH/HpaI aldolase/citrate lyase family protein [Methylophilaceae]|nr:MULTISPECIES: CoA ester lyase [Methylophilaceae]